MSLKQAKKAVIKAAVKRGLKAGKPVKSMTADQAANTMHQLSLVYDELDYKIRNAPDFKTALPLFKSGWRKAQATFAKLGAYATPDMIRITKNTFDAQTVRAAIDSSDPQKFLLYTVQSAFVRNDRWRKEIAYGGDK